MYEINAPFCFGAADKLRNIMPIVARPAKVMIVLLRHVPTIDATGLHALSEFHKQCAAKGTQVILAGVQPHLMKILRRWPDSQEIGRDNLCADIETALKRAKQFLAGSVRPTREEADDRDARKEVA